MKHKILSIIFLFLLFACQKNDTENDKALILSMTFDFGEVSFEGDEGSIKAPENTDVESLIPTIDISDGATVYPPSKAITDFTEPVDYSVISEDGENANYYTVSVTLPIVKFTVYDCSNRSATNPTSELASDATISVFKEVGGEMELIEELTSDENGEALFYGYRDSTYYFLAAKGDVTNLIDGYIIDGIFESQEDINNSPTQSQSSEIGDLKFEDLNRDGLVDTDDMVDYVTIYEIPETGVKELDVYIGEE